MIAASVAAAFSQVIADNYAARDPNAPPLRKAVQERDLKFRMTGIRGASVKMWRKRAWIA